MTECCKGRSLQGRGCECSRIASQNALGWPFIKSALIWIGAWIAHYVEWQDRKAANRHAHLAVMAARNRQLRRIRTAAIQTPFD